MAPVDMSLPCMQIVIDPADLGWLGTARHVRIPLDERVQAAIVERAAELGVEIGDIDGRGTTMIIVTGTAKGWLDADKLCAYIEGMQDVLSGDYGNAKVEVSRKDLRALVRGAASGSAIFGEDVRKACDRAQAALDGTVSDGQPVGT